MLEDDNDDDRDFITVYKKEYYPKKYTKVKKYIPPINYEPPCNSINGPFNEHLKLSSKNERSEDIAGFLQKVRKEKPHLQKFLPEDGPDEDVIKQAQKNIWKSVYKIEYPEKSDDEIKKEKVSLPDDWIIPETVQQRSFRNPKILMARKNQSPMETLIKPVNNLVPDSKQREILRVKTGDSEYIATIASTGDRIFKEKISEAPSRPRKIFQVKSPDCLVILKNIKYPVISHVF